MNTATFSARVHFHGSFWIVVIGDTAHTCLTNMQLLEAMKGRPPRRPETPPPPSTETVEEFIARGGSITRIAKPVLKPLPPAQPEQFQPAASRITLDFLGL